MAVIGTHKQLGRLNVPVIFAVAEGPDPGPIAERVNKDTPIPPEKGVDPRQVLIFAGLLIFGGYWALRNLVE